MRISDWSSDVCSSDLQPHQVADLIGGAFPVFAGKGVERQHLYAEVGRGLHDAAHRLHTPAMTHDARQETPLRPAAVAIHDDGDMAGAGMPARQDRKSTRLIQSLMRISYAVFCLKKKTKNKNLKFTQSITKIHIHEPALTPMH